MRQHSYHTLIASLPALPAGLDAECRLMTRPALEKRLQMLKSGDAEALAELLDFLSWDRQPLGRTDEEVIAGYRKLMGTTRHPLVRKIIAQRMDMRTIISAIRRRRLELGPPTGVGQWVDPIRRRWAEPGFGLLTRFPWVGELERLIASGATHEAERQMLVVTWDVWSRAASRHQFTFEAVLLYVARWALLNRWAAQDAAAGRQRFNKLLEQLVGDHVHFSN